MQAALEWYEVALRLGAAGILGATLGLERGATGHEAGLRTHVLVSLGSALFAVASVGAFDSFLTERAGTNVNVDVTRMAAYVAPGIGFIGAGVIVKHVRDRGAPFVSGLTTAASLWAAASIGVAAGLGFWSGALAAAAVALVVLVLARPLSSALEHRNRPGGLTTVDIRLDLDDDMSDLDAVRKLTERSQRWARVERVVVERPDDEGEPRCAFVSARLDPRTPDQVNELVADLTAVARLRSLDLSTG